MVKSICKKIISSISTCGNYTKEELEQMEYILIAILSELIKIISIISIFSLFGYFDKIIIISGIMCLLTPYIGGYHEETQFKCFIATLLFSVGILILSLQCNLSFLGNCILNSLSIFCIWNQTPVINSKMPITHPKLINKNRIRGLSISVILGIVSICLYNYTRYYSLITWTILFEVMLMFNKRKVELFGKTE